jgi:hypothetical protein
MDAGLWHLEPSATFRPRIVLYNIRSLPHEQEHIMDIRDAAATYMDELRVMTFSSDTACEQKASVERAAFGSRLQTFAKLSNAKLH